MRRKLAIALVIGMMFMTIGCGKTDTPKNDTPNSEATTQQESQAGEDNSDKGTTDGTTGEILKKDFEEKMAADATMSPQDLATGILTNSIIEFKGTTADVQEGLLTGFNEEVKGFDKGVMFAPMIGSIAFVGYIFTVPEGQDVDAFVESLKTNANPRWNVCTEADETIVEKSGNTVFFLMCPANLEE